MRALGESAASQDVPAVASIPEEIQTIRETKGQSQQLESLIVLGMHRSGTSMLTGALALCGAWVGADEDLTPPAAQNPKGFWERRDLRALCNRLLSALGAEWWRVADLDLGAAPPEALAEARAAWAEMDAGLGTGLRAVKEPRLCLLLPLLRHQIQGAVCLHIHRHPLEVARSLAARNGFGIAEGLALWEAYTRHALAASAGLPRLGLLHADLIVDPAATLERLGASLAALGTEGFALAPPAVLRDFVSVGLQHQHVTSGEAAAFLSPAQTALWAEILTNPVPEVDPGLSPATLQILRDLDSRQTARDRLTAAKKRATHLTGRAEKLEVALSEREDALAETRAALAEREDTLAETRATLAERDKTLTETVETLVNLEKLIIRRAEATDALQLRGKHSDMLRDYILRSRAPSFPALRHRLHLWIARRAVRRSALFDAKWYLRANPDVAKRKKDPALHYLTHGAYKGLDPGPKFSTIGYLLDHEDVRRSGVNPLVHYIRSGRKERRKVRKAGS